jgi:hypothetical protein
VASNRTRTGGRRGGGASCVNPKLRSSHGLFRDTIAEKDPRFSDPHRRQERRRGYLLMRQLGNAFCRSAMPGVGDHGVVEQEFPQVGQPVAVVT